MAVRGKVFIGTSGWTYYDWVGVFYPESLPSGERLGYFSKHFATAEINYSFYHLPRPETFEKWYRESSPGFVFAVKVSRFITHIKRLEGAEEAWQIFLGNALSLKEKLGPFLFQFPPSFRATDETVARLERFLTMISASDHKFAFEFRHSSWCAPPAYEVLRKYGAAWVIADSSRYPKAEAVTSRFVYVRMHGPEKLFASRYSHKDLAALASKIRGWQGDGLDVYVYFNNDYYGYAVENARELIELLRD